MPDPKKRPLQSHIVRLLSRQELERQILEVASSLAPDRPAGCADEEPPAPCWIEPRQLIRILAPFVSMN